MDKPVQDVWPAERKQWCESTAKYLQDCARPGYVHFRDGTEWVTLAKLPGWISAAPDHGSTFSVAVSNSLSLLLRQKFLSLSFSLSPSLSVCVHVYFFLNTFSSGSRCTIKLVVRQVVMGVLYLDNDWENFSPPVVIEWNLFSSNIHQVYLLTLSFYEIEWAPVI